MQTLTELFRPTLKLTRKTLRVGKRKLIGLLFILLVASIIGVLASRIVAFVLSLILGLISFFSLLLILNTAKALAHFKNQMLALNHRLKRTDHSLLSLKKQVGDKEQQLRQQDQLLNDKEQQLRQQDQLLNDKEQQLRQQDQLLNDKEQQLRQQDQLLNDKEQQLRQQDQLLDDRLTTLERQKIDINHLRVRLESSLLDSNPFKKSRDVILSLTTRAPSRRKRLFIFQALNGQNDYARLIYSEFARNQVDVFPLEKKSDFDSLQAGDLLQIHWTKSLLIGANDLNSAEQEMQRWISLFQGLKNRGVKLIWAVHEALPHECRFPSVEVDLRKHLAEMSDVIQILHHSTLDVVQEIFPIPADKCIVVPHPLYTGAQANYISRPEARARLGLKPSDFVLSSFGAIRPYKNHRAVLETLGELSENISDRQIVYLIAGPTQSDPAIKEYVAGLRRDIDSHRSTAIIRMHEGAVPADSVQFIQNASDLSLCPYNAGLNSGVLMLNLTYQLPTIISSNPVVDDIAQFGPVMTLNETNSKELSEKILAAKEGLGFKPLDPDFKSRHHPSLISTNFAKELNDRLDSLHG